MTGNRINKSCTTVNKRCNTSIDKMKRTVAVTPCNKSHLSTRSQSNSFQYARWSSTANRQSTCLRRKVHSGLAGNVTSDVLPQNLIAGGLITKHNK